MFCNGNRLKQENVIINYSEALVTKYYLVSPCLHGAEMSFFHEGEVLSLNCISRMQTPSIPTSHLYPSLNPSTSLLFLPISHPAKTYAHFPINFSDWIHGAYSPACELFTVINLMLKSLYSSWDDSSNASIKSTHIYITKFKICPKTYITGNWPHISLPEINGN